MPGWPPEPAAGGAHGSMIAHMIRRARQYQAPYRRRTGSLERLCNAVQGTARCQHIVDDGNMRPMQAPRESVQRLKAVHAGRTAQLALLDTLTHSSLDARREGKECVITGTTRW